MVEEDQNSLVAEMVEEDQNSLVAEMVEEDQNSLVANTDVAMSETTADWSTKYLELLRANISEVEGQGRACHADTFRRVVFHATVKLLQDDSTMLQQLQQQADQNMVRWQAESASVGKAQTAEWFNVKYADNDQLCKRLEYKVGDTSVYVCEGDWGDVAQKFTQRFGKTFGVLNMANAFVAGGGVVDGMIAQEENMYRRSDCWLKARDSSKTEGANAGQVDNLFYIDELQETATLHVDERRVCFIGQDVCGYHQDPELVDISYRPLAEDKVFPFFEFKAAAYDTRPYHNWPRFKKGHLKGYEESMRRRMDNQFQELVNKQVRHVELSAFGCGAFINRAWPQLEQQNMVRKVAQMYLEAIEQHGANFDVIAFGIYDGAGYGATANSRLFHEVFSERSTARKPGLMSGMFTGFGGSK
jgi:hypothetical protein